MKSKRNVLTLVVSIIIFLGFFVSCIFGLGRIHLSYRRILNENVKPMTILQDAIEQVYSIELDVGNAVTYSMSSNNVNDITQYADKIYYSLMTLENTLYDYSEYDMTELEQSRFNLLNGYIKNYESILTRLRDLASSSNYEEVYRVYNQDFKPNCIAVRELLKSLIDVDAELVNNKRTLIVRGVMKESSNVIIEGVAILIGFIVVNAIRIKNEKKLQKALKSNTRAKESLSEMVYTDVLTGLSNRNALMNKLDTLKLNDNQTLYACMFNVNSFSEVNTKFGSRLGDVVLTEFARRLKESFPKADVYRTNGDEFIVLSVLSSGVVSYNNYLSSLTNARNLLVQTYPIETTSVSLTHSVSLVKKTGQATVDFTIIDVLKEALDRGRLSQMDSVSYIDLDTISQYQENTRG